MGGVGDETPLRVLFVTNMWPEGGAFRGVFVEQLATSLRALGHQVDVEIVAQGRGQGDYFMAARRVRRRAMRGNYDLVHVHFGMTALAARFVSRPRVITLYGSDINSAPRRWLTRLGWGGAAARIYVASGLAARAKDRRASIVPNGVDFALFKPGDRTAARAHFGIAPSDRVVLFGSAPDRRVKGYDTYSAVLDELRQRGLAVRELILSAPGQPVREVVRKMDAADVLLFTSRYGSEGSPTVIKEAMAMGLPVVSVAVGDVAEMLDGIEPSAVVPYVIDRQQVTRPDLVEQLARATASVLEDGRRSNGRELREWLDLPSVGERVVSLYRSVTRS